MPSRDGVNVTTLSPKNRATFNTVFAAVLFCGNIQMTRFALDLPRMTRRFCSSLGLRGSFEPADTISKLALPTRWMIAAEDMPTLAFVTHWRRCGPVPTAMLSPAIRQSSMEGFQ